MTLPDPAPHPTLLRRARLPRWALPREWPLTNREPACADIALKAGRIESIVPSRDGIASSDGEWDLAGSPVLPGLVDAHTHIDKTFTLDRIDVVTPGLLGAKEAMTRVRSGFTRDDVLARAERALQWAFEAGVVRLRTHVDWWDPQHAPLAWEPLAELAQAWAGRVTLERVSLVPLGFHAQRDSAMALARKVASGASGGLLGAFVHSTVWDPLALRHLLEAAAALDLDVDLHVDEELNPQACGLAETARLLRELRFPGRVVCGHVCALAAQADAVALRTLDAVSEVPITLVSLPITNLLLQDAHVGRTPRQRGLTLVKEARARGIPLLIASDNVQDAFCAVGSYDPVEALLAGVLAGQLDDAFDVWSETLCRLDWLSRLPSMAASLVDARADLVIFTATAAAGWPSRAHRRVVLRDGRLMAGQLPKAWSSGGAVMRTRPAGITSLRPTCVSASSNSPSSRTVES